MASLMESLYDRWLNDLWNGDLRTLETTAADLVTGDFTGHWPGRPALVRGPAELADIVRQGHLPFQGLRFTARLGPIVEGAMLAARWAAHGIYAGGENPIPGATAAPGTPVQFHGHDILRASGDRLAEYWVVTETDHLLNQLR